MKTLPLCALFAALTLPIHAQKMATPTGEAPGPWILGTVGVGKTADPKVPLTTALKGLAIKVGENAAVAYDLDLGRMAGAWTGPFTTPMNLMSRGEYPTALGEVAFTTGEVPGFLLPEPGRAHRGESGPFQRTGSPAGSSGHASGSSGRAPGSSERAPGSSERASGSSGRASGSSGRASGSSERASGSSGRASGSSGRASGSSGEPLFAQSESADPQSKLSADWPDPRPEPFGPLPPGQARFKGFYVNGDKTILKWDLGGVEVLEMPVYEGGEFIRKIETADPKVALRPIPGATVTKSTELRALTKGGPARWPETVTTTGEVSAKADEAYVVDTIRLPDPNPWGAPMFVGGFDFFPDGRAAVCTFHGDVFVVSGIDAKLERVTWRRFASGLYHALGLKIVNGEIYVTCRDGLWRLQDLNGDGEADFYEAFNFDLKATKNFHEFVFDLQTDAAGNFYFIKAGPVKNGGRGFDEIMGHHGALLRVSPDGGKLDVIATGFRAPNGIGVGPDGQLTSGDNEGTWTPACKINWIQPGGFYGVVPLSHRDPLPTDYDRPLCWLPKRVDNSGGGQVWVPPGEKWGPWSGQMLHLSYGTCSVFGVMKETVRPTATVTVPTGVAPPEIPALPPVVQGGVVRFPVNFQSGIMRARFHPTDGQLYVGGLRGWQTTGVKNGALQRVRYTGAPVRMPIGLHATKRGVRLDFTCALDPATAGDAQNWNVEVWNYLWSAAYGSPELSTLAPLEKPGDVGKDGEAQFSKTQATLKKHDPLVVKSATLSADGRSVFLEIPEIQPVMQMAIKFGIKTADGAELRSEVIHTIHALAPE